MKLYQNIMGFSEYECKADKHKQNNRMKGGVLKY